MKIGIKPLELFATGRYKDGGSEGLKDKYGNIYWQCFKFGDKNLKYKGKIFKGSINDFPKKINLAKGIFKLPNGKIIEQ